MYPTYFSAAAIASSRSSSSTGFSRYRKLTLAVLEREGHSAVVAVNGRRAVELCASRDFDLVLMDVQMPEMDGLEATAAIRAAERTTGRRVPIVAMTAPLYGDREACLRAGIDDYVSKAIRRRDLLRVLQRAEPTQRRIGL